MARTLRVGAQFRGCGGIAILGRTANAVASAGADTSEAGSKVTEVTASDPAKRQNEARRSEMPKPPKAVAAATPGGTDG